MMLKKKTSSSRLRHKLALQKEVRSADGVGGYAKSWQTIAELWAEIKPATGNEQPYAGQLQASATYKIIIRYRSGLSVGMRFLYESRALNIRAVFNVEERDDLLEVIAQEGVAT